MNLEGEEDETGKMNLEGEEDEPGRNAMTAT